MAKISCCSIVYRWLNSYIKSMQIKVDLQFMYLYYHTITQTSIKKKRKIVIMVKKLKKIINCPFVLFEIDILIYGNLAIIFLAYVN